MKFGEAIKALKDGKAIQRAGWNGKGLFVVKQIPATLEGLIIDKVQSLPESAKELLKKNNQVPIIKYTNQMLIINPDGRADSWVPSSSDIFADDWKVWDSQKQEFVEPDWLYRLKEEFDNLGEDLEALGMALSSDDFCCGIDSKQLRLLEEQEKHMEGYYDVLKYRLELNGVNLQ